jgi:hypothetical protein
MTTSAAPDTASSTPSRRVVRGLWAASALALALAPFSVPTFGAGIALGVGLIVVGVVFQRRGFAARRYIAVGVIAVVLGVASAGACGWFVLRPAEVTGGEERRQDRVEARFNSAFDNAANAPGAEADVGHTTDDAGPAVDADSPARKPPAAGGVQEPR